MSIPAELDVTPVVSEEDKNNVSSVSAAIESVVRASGDDSKHIVAKVAEKAIGKALICRTIFSNVVILLLHHFKTTKTKLVENISTNRVRIPKKEK